MRVLSIVLVLLCAVPAVADELRLLDGEVVYGSVTGEEKGRYLVETGEGPRKINVADVAERLEGDAPHVVLARRRAALAPDDVSERVELVGFAWRHRLDDAAQELAREALEQGSDDALVVGLVGDGWAAPFGRPGVVGPRWGSAKKKALSRRGGSTGTEKAARAALDWLAAHQDTDGRLDADGFMKHDSDDDKTDGAGGGHHGERVPCPYDGVTTALSVMAWLASGSTPVSGPYADNVKRGIGFLDGVLHRGMAGFDAIWNVSFATHALSDAYAVTRDPVLRRAVERGVEALWQGQQADGGWRYFRGASGVPSTSCATVALGAARNAGLSLDTRRVEKILAFLDARVDPGSGRSEYHDGAERLGYTPTLRNAASALACRGMLGALTGTRLLGKQVSAVSAKAPKWKIEFKKLKGPDGQMREFQIGNLDPYAWYFTTLALSLYKSASLKSWYGGLQSALLSGQRKDGAAAGSWDPLGNYSDSGGRAFVTGLCALMLQAPYRYPAP